MASQAESETRLMKSDWVRGNLCCFPGHCLSGLQRTHGLLLVVVLPPDRKARLLREALKQLCPTAALKDPAEAGQPDPGRLCRVPSTRITVGIRNTLVLGEQGQVPLLTEVFSM